MDDSGGFGEGREMKRPALRAIGCSLLALVAGKDELKP
jgi:hypothetical protein